MGKVHINSLVYLAKEVGYTPKPHLYKVNMASEYGSTIQNKVLKKLLGQITPIDFLTIAYPQAIELIKELENNPTKERAGEIMKELARFKLSNKHYIIITIEQALKVAKEKNWNLCKNHDFVYAFNECYWENIEKEGLQNFLGEASEIMGVGKYSARYYQFKELLFKQFISTAYLPTPENKNNTVLINLLNGTFEISASGTKLKAFDSSDFLTYQLPFEYNPTAAAPLFEAYLNRVLPDKERQAVLAEYLGFVFFKHGNSVLKEEKALILYGSGANGKSVFFEIVIALLGTENVSNYSLQSLTNESGYYRAKLANKLLNYASEINGNLEAAIFKQLVSGEPIEARPPYGEPFILKQYAKLIFNTNTLPREVEHTNAYFRRFLIIPFDVTIPEEEQDKELHSKIIEKELSGVFNWVLEGLQRLLANKKFSPCEAARLTVEQYKMESNSVRMFLEEEGYYVDSEGKYSYKKLYEEYKLYCSQGGMTPFKKINFKKQLQEIKIVVMNDNGNNIVLIAQKPEKKNVPRFSYFS